MSLFATNRRSFDCASARRASAPEKKRRGRFAQDDNS
jgi:hypothetical protein